MPKRDSELIEFGKCAQALAKWLDKGLTLDIVDQIWLENHLELIQMAYSAWKRRHAAEDQQRSD